MNALDGEHEHPAWTFTAVGFHVAIGVALLVWWIGPSISFTSYGEPDMPFEEPDMPFERRAWLEQQGVHAMCADLVENHLRPGRTRADVIELLGPAVHDTPLVLGWDVKGMGYHLNVVLDDDGRVVRAFVEPW